MATFTTEPAEGEGYGAATVTSAGPYTGGPDPAAGYGAAAWDGSGPYLAEPPWGDGHGTASVTSAGPYPAEPPWGPGYGAGAFIPSGTFASVEITVVDTEGAVVTEAIRVICNAEFDTSVELSDGVGELEALQNAYDQFVVIGEVTGQAHNVAWYSVDEQQESIHPGLHDEGEVVVDPVYPQAAEGSDFVFIEGEPVALGDEDNTVEGTSPVVTFDGN